MHGYRSDLILRQKLLISLPCLRRKAFLYDPDSFRFAYKISAIKHRCNKCWPLIVGLYTLIKASGPKRHPRRLIMKLYILLARTDHQVRDETWTTLAPPSLGPGVSVGERGKKRSEIAEKSLSEASQSGRFGRVKGHLSSRLASFANFFGLYHTQKQRKIKIKPRMKLNHNIWLIRLVGAEGSFPLPLSPAPCETLFIRPNRRACSHANS